MLPPVLEIYIVWHPDDRAGEEIAMHVLRHFHGTSYTGLIGGAVEVYLRSNGWEEIRSAPRPIPFPEKHSTRSVKPSEFVVVLPIMGLEMAANVEREESSWHEYLSEIVATSQAKSENVAIFPYQIDNGVLHGTRLGTMFGRYQGLAATQPYPEGDSTPNAICRELAQGITQFLDPERNKRLTVFLSHTKRSRPGGEEDTTGLIALIRDVVAQTRLSEYFDASDLQPGGDWDNELRSHAARSAMLAIRTDLYPSREWCQREVRIAKVSGMPVLVLDAIGEGEERGSFLMDHVPRLPVSNAEGNWRRADIFKALNLLVDECLKRALWSHQARIANSQGAIEVAWWAPHAPEPLTLLDWLTKHSADARNKWNRDNPLIVLHPDPPLGPDEVIVMQQLIDVAGIPAVLDVMTPRLLAARGG